MRYGRTFYILISHNNVGSRRLNHGMQCTVIQYFIVDLAVSGLLIRKHFDFGHAIDGQKALSQPFRSFLIQDLNV